MEEEIRSNKLSSLQHPYCNVCLLVKEYRKDEKVSELPEIVEVPDQSELWMHAYSKPEIKIKTSPLLKCKVCHLIGTKILH